MTSHPAAPFAYPINAHQYRHGPSGYVDYKSFRPWLRDEFDYRCAYCLFRERWCPVLAFHLDHFVAQTVDNSKVTSYRNLLYACPACNTRKSSLPIPSPAKVFTAEAITINEDGTVETKTSKARELVRILGLDSPEYNEWRRLMIGIIALAASVKRGSRLSLFRELMSYPDQLPDLTRLNPPENYRN